MELARRVAAGDHRLLVHPSVSDEIANDNDEDRRRLRELVRDRYLTLDHPPHPDGELSRLLGSPAAGSNSWYDNQLLACVVSNAVHGLITQDEGIHRKARRLGVDDRVHTLADAVTMLSRLNPQDETFDPVVDTVPLHTLDLGDPIFDSLKGEYGEFENWFEAAARDGRPAFVVRDPDGHLVGICIFKGTDQGIDTGRNPGKVSTFKVASEVKGSKYGELLLKVLLKTVAGVHDLVWLTVYPRHEGLIGFLNNFGFFEFDRKADGELVLAKQLEPLTPFTGGQSALEFHVQHGPPALAIVEDQVFLIPIQPEFHESLFPDAPNAQMSIVAPRPHGNAIRKAYLSLANLRRIDPGATLLFYRSGDFQSVTAIGVLEAAMSSSDPEEIIEFVGIRTVYSSEEVEEMTSRGEVLAFLFRQDRFLNRPIGMRELLENDVARRAPQTTIRVNPDGLEWLRTRLNE